MEVFSTAHQSLDASVTSDSVSHANEDYQASTPKSHLLTGWEMHSPLCNNTIFTPASCKVHDHEKPQTGIFRFDSTSARYFWFPAACWTKKAHIQTRTLLPQKENREQRKSKHCYRRGLLSRIEVYNDQIARGGKFKMKDYDVYQELNDHQLFDCGKNKLYKLLRSPTQLPRVDFLSTSQQTKSHHNTLVWHSCFGELSIEFPFNNNSFLSANILK